MPDTLDYERRSDKRSSLGAAFAFGSLVGIMLTVPAVILGLASAAASPRGDGPILPALFPSLVVLDVFPVSMGPMHPVPVTVA